MRVNCRRKIVEVWLDEATLLSEIPYEFLKKELEETTELLKILMELTTKLRYKGVPRVENTGSR